MSDELKPCPFCGVLPDLGTFQCGEIVLPGLCAHPPSIWPVHCPADTGRACAIEQWNQRAAPQEPTAWAVEQDGRIVAVCMMSDGSAEYQNQRDPRYDGRPCTLRPLYLGASSLGPDRKEGV
jgi:hypothetical protein